jgi:hypothetical protein
MHCLIRMIRGGSRQVIRGDRRYVILVDPRGKGAS